MVTPDSGMPFASRIFPVTIRWAGGETTLGRAESCILPAALGACEIVPHGTADLIACYVPDLERDIVAPLRAAGRQQPSSSSSSQAANTVAECAARRRVELYRCLGAC